MTPPATRRELLAITAVALAALVVSTAVMWARSEDASSWDVPLYELYGERMADGSAPYADFRVEYPPGALPAFLLPELAARAWGPSGESVYEPTLNGPARSYSMWFALSMVLAMSVTVVAAAACASSLRSSRAESAAAILVVALTPALLGDLSITRFDALPVALSAVAVALMARRRALWSAVVLGLGIATKLFPVLFLPLLVIHAWRSEGRRRGLVTAAVASTAAVLPFVPFLITSGGDALYPLRAQLTRGLHAESLPGSLAVALDGFLERAVGVDLVWVSEGGTGLVKSAEVVGRTGSLLSALCTLIGVAAICFVYLRAARGPVTTRHLVTACAAVVTTQLAFGRVLSPQFLLWLIPFVPLAATQVGRRAASFGLYTAAVVATNVWFPPIYRRYVNGQPPLPVMFVVFRNALLVGLALVLLAALRRAPTGSAEPAAASD